MSQYHLILTRTAQRQLTDKLPEAIAAAAFELIIGDLLVSPYRLGKPLDDPFEGQWSARRGTYRVLYLIDDRTRAVTVIDVLARSDAYRTR